MKQSIVSTIQSARRSLLVVVIGSFLITSTIASADDAAMMNRLVKLERALDNRGLLDLLTQVERLQQQVQRLSGQIEEQQYALDQIRDTQRQTYVDLDQRLQQAERGNVMLGAASGDGTTIAPPLTTIMPGTSDPVAGTSSDSPFQITPPADGTSTPALGDDPSVDSNIAPSDENVALPSQAPRVPPTSGVSIDNADSEAAYGEAFNLLKAGQYDESISAFSAFLNQHPNSQYADNAQYWLGETYYVKREFDAALVEYHKLLQLYPTSKKQSHAMLKIGYSYHELGQRDQARAILEDLRTRFPGSTAARLAEERIALLMQNASR